ncbi:MAG: symmetrical bis(5'-nucleosyl)-tetraphosphatase [Gammaproteobacteria bacterium]
MATYAIGDLQGCLEPLQRLLDAVHYDPASDQLWFAGDLVNRGPDSLATLRFVRSLQNRITVLGNHDLHLLASAQGDRRYDRAGDTIEEILRAEDAGELLHWVRHQPLLHHDAELGFTLIHAGLPPQWDLTLAQRAAREVESLLRSENYQDFLAVMYGNEPRQWSANLATIERARIIVNCFTRMRYCTQEGVLDLKSKGAPGTQPFGMRPWFDWPQRANHNERILFGHWSTLGANQVSEHVWSLDSGCLWGGQLSAFHLEEQRYIRVDCPSFKKPDQVRA